MNRIRLLPEQVANQIAAGEVVERPASVVKELVENALDAQAGRLHVEVAAGGRSLIRVTDDGWGMSRDDALLCLERHATSKIRRAEDLALVTTMGFRGEALPSIASVSRFSLTTREREDATGEATRVILNGGRMVEVKSAAGPAGTCIEVRQLFFNLPARRKFLRTEETERAHIQHYLTLAALAHPEVAFTFTSDGRPVWQLPALRSSNDPERAAALRERLRQLHGDTSLLALDFSADLGPDTSADESGSEATPVAGAGEGNGPLRWRFRLWGFIGSPGVSRATRDEQHLFVNRRPIENRGLNFALLEGYHTVLMKGRYPVCCLSLEIDPAAVDVNIHPAKREVKFRDEATVRRLVAQAVREVLLRFHAPPKSGATRETGADGGAIGRPAPQSSAPPPEFRLAALVPAVPKNEQATLSMGFSRREPTDSTGDARSVGTKSATSTTTEATAPLPAVDPRSLARGSEAPGATAAEPGSSAPMPPSAVPVPLLHVPLRVVGVVGRLYVVLESDRGLVLMDQHAAHERILFEQMMQRLEQAGSAASQRLLLPETVELPARDADFVRRNLETLGRLGVGLTEFGERTFLLDALPPFVRGGNPKQFARALIDELKAAGAQVNALRLGEDVVAKTVCRHAVKANDPLKGPELQHLVNDLRRCAMPYTCPHGRPTLIEMNWRELDRKFGRTA